MKGPGFNYSTFLELLKALVKVRLSILGPISSVTHYP